MRSTILLSTAAILALAGCDQRPTKPPPAAMSAADLASELQRCKALGLDSYKDPACEAAKKEDRSRFLGKSKAPGQ